MLIFENKLLYKAEIILEIQAKYDFENSTHI